MQSKLFPGVRVLDVSHVLAGPFCSYQLALLGADVLKIENPAARDMVRYSGPDEARRERGLGPGFLMQNAGKRSLAVNLRAPEGAEILRRLAAGADVLIENFRPGRMARLGLAYDDLKSTNPRLIYCSITGFGQTGPLSQLPAYDHVVQGISGMMAANASDDGRPWRVGFPLVDYNVGLLAAFAVAGALYERERSGSGRYIDVAMLDAALITMGPLLAAPLLGLPAPVRRGGRAASGSPFSGLFDTSDGIVSVAANTPAQARNLADALGCGELVDDPRFARWGADDAYVGEVQAALGRIFAEAPAAAWEERLAAAGVPASKVRTIAEVLEHPQVAARGLLRGVAGRAGLSDGHQVPGPGVWLDDGPPDDLAPPPRPGEHTRAVLAELGYDEPAVAMLRRDGVVDWPDER